MKNRFVLQVMAVALIGAAHIVCASQKIVTKPDLEVTMRMKDHIHNKADNNHFWFDSNKKKTDKLGWPCPNNQTYVKVEWLCRNDKDEEMHWLMSRLLLSKNIIIGAYKKNELTISSCMGMLIAHPLPEYICYNELIVNKRQSIDLSAHGCVIQVKIIDDYKPHYWTSADKTIPMGLVFYEIFRDVIVKPVMVVGGTGFILCLLIKILSLN